MHWININKKKLYIVT